MQRDCLTDALLDFLDRGASGDTTGQVGTYAAKLASAFSMTMA
jgi:hypothetical protein